MKENKLSFTKYFIFCSPEPTANAIGEKLKGKYHDHAELCPSEVIKADSRLVQIKTDTHGNALRELDNSIRLDTVEEFQDEINCLSPKQVTNVINTVQPGTCISISGPRGIGKTTFIKRMCYCWALGYCLWKYELLFWINLSATPDEPLQNLPQLLTAALSSTHVSDSELQLAVREIIELNGQGVVIVLDHFKSELHSELLSNILRLKKITIIVSTYQAVKEATIHFQMLGLTDKQISQHVLHHYHYDQSRTEAFLRYLSSIPHLSYLKKIPVYLLGLLAVFDSIPTAYLPETLMTFLACLTIVKFNTQERIKHRIQQLNTMPISDFFKSLSLPVGPHFQYLYSHEKLLLNRRAFWMHRVHVALPLRSGEWMQLTEYPLLYDMLASLHLCSLQQPLELTLSHLSRHKEHLCFTIMLSPHIKEEAMRQAQDTMITAYTGNYDSGITPRWGILESISVSHVAISARAMYTLVSGGNRLDFSRCTFSPGAAAVLANSIGSGSSMHKMESDRSVVEYVW